MTIRTLCGLVLPLSLVAAAGCSIAERRATTAADWRAVQRAAASDVAVATLVTARSDDVATDLQATSPLTTPAHGCTIAAQLSLTDDWDRLPAEFFADVHSAYRCENMLLLLAAGGASYAIHKTVDDDVEDFYNEHPNRWDKGQEFFAAIGNPGHHFAAVAGMYAWSLHTQDAEMHDLSLALFNAVSITGLSTMFLKATVGANTESPNGQQDPFGGAWPSGHTSSSFAFAAVLDEYYGHRVGVPAYMLAGLVGWERIDDGEHDLSDVVFGAVLGYVIGKTVACDHHVRFCGMELQPHVDAATGATGIAFERRF